VALVTTFRIVGVTLMTTLRLSCGPFEFCLYATRGPRGHFVTQAGVAGGFVMMLTTRSEKTLPQT
jgi:hypothetical protein